MTAEEEKYWTESLTVIRQGVATLQKRRIELQAKLTATAKLRSYYQMRYGDTRVALIESRLDNRGLENMVAALQEQLGDKGPDLKLGNDLDVV